ncbi:hypothetical protein H5410_039394, partial [Solanum commersonii]
YGPVLWMPVDATGNPNPDVGGVDAGGKIWRFSGAKSWIRIRKNAPTKAVKSIVVSWPAVQKRWMLILDACTTTQMNSICVEKNKRNSKRHVLVDWSPK